MHQLQQELSAIDELGVKGSKQNSVETEHVQRIDRKLKKWFRQKPKNSKAQPAAS